MGIVIKQGFYNTLWLAIGIAIGYVNTILLFPVFFTADQFGLTRVLWAAGTVFAQFALLGSPQILIKFFPNFNKTSKERGGFFTLMLLIPLLGFIVYFILVNIFQGQIINSYANKSSLFGENFHYIYFITFFFIYFNVLEAYLRALLKTTVAAFLKNVVLRIIWLTLIIMFHENIINFETFIFWFVNAYGIILIILVIYAIAIKSFKINLYFTFLSKKQLKEITIFGLFVILGGSTTYLANYIDVLMVGGMINLKSVAFYSVAFYLGTVILLPFNGTSNILTPLISNGFSKKDFKKVNEIYQKASVNLSLISMLIFLGIWLNADNIFKLLPANYAAGKYVLLFIALAKLFGGSIGVNGFILQFSPYYKKLLLFNIIFFGIVVITNYIFIPILGITGAALATFLSQVIINVIQMTYIYLKMKMLPLGIKNLKIVLLGGLVYIILLFIPEQNNIWIDIFLRSAIITILYMPIAYFWNISEEYTTRINKLLSIAGK